MPAPTPQTITVTLPAQQQQQAQVTLQPSLQVAQPPSEPLPTPTNISAPTPPVPQPNPQVPTTIKILGKLEDMKGRWSITSTSTASVWFLVLNFADLICHVWMPKSLKCHSSTCANPQYLLPGRRVIYFI